MTASQLRRLLKAHNVTMVELGRRLGTDKDHISKWSRGERTIPQRSAIAIKCVLEHQEVSND